MNSYRTNALLDRCRVGVATKNQVADLAARELGSFIIFHSLYKNFTELPTELELRVELLDDVELNPGNYPQDIFEEDDAEEDFPPDDGPLVA